MQVKLLKDHNGNKAGDEIIVTIDRANYLVNCKVAQYKKESVQKPGPKPKADKK